MKMRNSVVLALVVLAASSQAAVITQWNFNSTSPDATSTTGSTDPSTGAGLASLIGGTTSTFASGFGSTDPAASDNTAWNSAGYTAQGTGSGTAGVRFAVSTAGKKDIVVSWDDRHSATASGYTQLQYTTDGTNFVAVGNFLNTDTNFANGNSVNLTGVAGVDNNANFAFQIVSIFAPGTSAYAASTSTGTYGTNGTIRYDMVTVSGTQAVPEPATMTILGLGALALARRARK